ncbi:MAG: hypothetical protein IJ400_04885 [Clostridia bacterium]|nr:hypothetical protein [Clostridia bacterium]
MENFIHHLPQHCKLTCECCGEKIIKGQEYYSLLDNHFHSDCLLDNYTPYEILSILGIEEKIAQDLPPFNSKLVAIGKYKNIRVLQGFYDYFCSRFENYKEIIESLSTLKWKNGIETNASDQAILERWALRKERESNQ